MRILPIVLTLGPLLASVVSASAQCRSGAADEAGCYRPTDLHISAAVVGGPPLIWSSVDGALVPPPAGISGWGMGRTIPLDRLIGRKIAPVGIPTQRLTYNNPSSFPGAVDPATVLIPLLPAKRPARFRGVYQ